jgi:exodeoxyribonuclease V gamma subunit
MCVHNPCQHYWADIVADRDLLRGCGRASSGGRVRRWRSPRNCCTCTRSRCSPPGASRGAISSACSTSTTTMRTRAATLPQFAGHRAAHRPVQGLWRQDAAAATAGRHPRVAPAAGDARALAGGRSGARRVDPLPCRAQPAARGRDPPRSVARRLQRRRQPAPARHHRHGPGHRYATRRTSRRCFGLLEASDPRYLPFSVADQGRRHFDPLLQALEKLLDLPQSRLAVSDLLDLLDVPALRQRFASPKTTCRNCSAGYAAPISAGACTPSSAPASICRSRRMPRRRTPGCSACGGCCSATPLVPTPRPGRRSSLTTKSAASTPPARAAGAVARRLDATWRVLREPATVATGACACALLADFFCRRRQRRRLHPAAARQRPGALAGGLRRGGAGRSAALSVVGEYWLSRLRRGRPVAALLRRRRHLRHADADARHSLPPCLPARHERRRLPAQRIADGLRPDGPRLPPGRPFAPRGRSLSVPRSAAFGARRPAHLVGRPQHHTTTACGRRRCWSGSCAIIWPPAGRWPVIPGKAGKAGEALLAALTVEHRLQPFSADYFPAFPAGSQAVHLRAGMAAGWWRGRCDAGRTGGRTAPAAAAAAREPLSLRDLGDFLRQPVGLSFGSASAFPSSATIR